MNSNIIYYHYWIPRSSLRVLTSPFPRRSVIIPNIISRSLRLRQDKGGGAWCPRYMLTKEGKEYLEVNLHSSRLLTSAKTQGRFGNGHGVEYTEEYFVEYWRPGFNKWVRWRNRRGLEVGTIWLGHRSKHAWDFFLVDLKVRIECASTDIIKMIP